MSGPAYDTLEAASGHGTEEVDAWPLTYLGTEPSTEAARGTAISRDHARHPARVDGFATKAADATSVHMRAAEEYDTFAFVVNLNQSPVMIAGRREGRRYITLSVPTSLLSSGGAAVTVAGVQFARDPSRLASNTGYQLNPGDSAEVDSEGPVYVAPLPGNAQGVVQILEAYDPPTRVKITP